MYTPLGEITIGGVEAGGMCADDGLVTGIGGWMLTGGVELDRLFVFDSPRS